MITGSISLISKLETNFSNIVDNFWIEVQDFVGFALLQALVLTSSIWLSLCALLFSSEFSFESIFGVTIT